MLGNKPIFRNLNNLTSNMGCSIIKTFVFLDSETTGLPHYENNRTRMTELCLTAVQSDHIDLGTFPRIQNKISLCFNPGKCIQPESTNVTGLTNELLEYQPAFDSRIFEILQDFLNLQLKPICLVAHNGDGFDYPILQAELQRSKKQLSEDILCIDSLKAFREFHKQDRDRNNSGNMASTSKVNEVPLEFQDGYDQLLSDVLNDLLNTTNITVLDNEESNNSKKLLTIEEIQRRNETTPKKKSSNDSPQMGQLRASPDNEAHANITVKRELFNEQRPSFKLGNVYQKLTGKVPINAHKAEVDVAMLIECAAVMGERFTQWANQNAKHFCDIPVMTPGKRIGT